jgi:hypothetical protein
MTRDASPAPSPHTSASRTAGPSLEPSLRHLPTRDSPTGASDEGPRPRRVAAHATPAGTHLPCVDNYNTVLSVSTTHGCVAPVQSLDGVVFVGDDAVMASLSDALLVFYRRCVREWMSKGRSKADLVKRAGRVTKTVQGLDYHLKGERTIPLADIDATADALGYKTRKVALDLADIADEIEGRRVFKGRLTDLDDDQIGEREAGAPGERAAARLRRLNARGVRPGARGDSAEEETRGAPKRPTPDRPAPRRNHDD